LANTGKSFFIWGLLRHFSLGKTYVTQVWAKRQFSFSH
jgi:hypothetical protein